MFIFSTTHTSATTHYGSSPTNTKICKTSLVNTPLKGKSSYILSLPDGILTLVPIVDNNCADVVFNISGLNSVSNLNYTVTSNEVTYNSEYINGNGDLVMDAVVFQIPGNVAEAYFTGTCQLNGNTYSFNILFYIYRCCTYTQASDYIFKDGELMSAQLGGNNSLAGVSISIEGNVIADGDYNFDGCILYFSRDSKMTINPSQIIGMTNCNLQPCDNWRWDGIRVLDAATLTMDDCTMEGAIRGIDLDIGTTFTANNNTFTNNYNTVFFNNVGATSTHLIANNTFMCEPFDFNSIILAPNSTVNFVVNSEFTTAIVAENSIVITIGTTLNTYNTTSPNSFNFQKFAYIYATTNAEVAIYNQDFGFAQECVYITDESYAVVGGTGTNQPNTFDQASTTGAANYDNSTGVYVYDKSGVYVENNVFNKLKTGIKVENCGSTFLGYAAAELITNTIDAKAGIIATSDLTTGCRIRMYNNDIYALNTGIKVKYYAEVAQPIGPGDKIYINQNTIETKAPTVVNYNSRGIYIINNPLDIIVGDNTIFTSSPYTPGTTNHPNVIGVNIEDYCSAVLSDNSISNYDNGLVMDNDNGKTLFSCLTLKDCRTGILYRNITADHLQGVSNYQSSPSGRSNVVFNDGNIPTTVLQRVNVEPPPSNVLAGLANWYNDGNTIIGSPENPSGGNFIFGFNPPLLGAPFFSNCLTLPNYKKEITKPTIEFNYKVYPNPITYGSFEIDMENYNNATYQIQSLSGSVVQKGGLKNHANTVKVDVKSGVYYLMIVNNEKVYYEKLLVLHP